MEDWRLLCDYVDNGSEAAFTALVNRHIGLVYSAALRKLGNRQAAEEVTQSVFCLLARKAGRLHAETALVGWLYRTASFTAAKYWRSESRRQHREQEAARMIPDPSIQDPSWEQLAPYLDEAMGQIREQDRLAILLRFFQGKPFPQVGQALGISEDAARMRVDRALEKLRQCLVRRGITLSGTALATALTAPAITAAPAGLAPIIASAALGTAAATSGISTTLLNLMASTKFKVGLATLALLGTGTLLILQHQAKAKLEAQNRALSQQLALVNAPETPPVAPVPAVDEAEVERLYAERRELLRLRGEVALLRREQRERAAPAGQVETSQSLTARDFYERGWKHEREQRYDEALADYSKAIELDPTFQNALFGRASLYSTHVRENKRDYAKAVADYTRILEIAPTNYSSRFNRAGAYNFLRQYDEAISDYSRIIEDPDTDFSRQVAGKDKNLALTYHYRGRLYHWHKKDNAKALADYTEALRLDPSIEMVHYRRGQIYLSFQQYENAEQDFAAALAQDPEYPLLHKEIDSLATAYAQKGRFTEAIRVLSKTIPLLSDTHAQLRESMQTRIAQYEAQRP